MADAPSIPGDPDDSISSARRVFYALLGTIEALQTPHHALFRAHGLTGPSFNVLRVLLETERDPSNSSDVGLPVETVARQMIQRDPDVSRLSRRLEEKGLVTKFRDSQDGRVHRIALTPRGRDLVDTLMHTCHGLLEEQFRGLDGAERDAMLGALARLRDGASGGSSIPDPRK